MRMAALAAALAPLALLAQDTAVDSRFEVVSVKRSPPDGGPMGIGLYTYPGGRLLATSYTLRALIHDAYDLPEYRIAGGPVWADVDRFDVEAKPAETSALRHWAPADFKSPPHPEMRRMLQSLLAERFGLKVHRETRKEPVYVLRVAKGGPRLKPPASTTVQAFVSFLPHGLQGRNATMDQLTERLARILKRPVLNQTGLEGNYDFLIEYTPDEEDADHTTPLLRALQDQAGLKLDTQPGSVEIVVIDRAERPSQN